MEAKEMELEHNSRDESSHSAFPLGRLMPGSLRGREIVGFWFTECL